MKSGSLWGKMVASGARLKYIKYFIKLNWFKKSDRDQPKQIESNSDKLINKKIEYNKFGFPIDINRK
jgi:hypothetical protein